MLSISIPIEISVAVNAEVPLYATSFAMPIIWPMDRKHSCCNGVACLPIQRDQFFLVRPFKWAYLSWCEPGVDAPSKFLLISYRNIKQISLCFSKYLEQVNSHIFLSVHFFHFDWNFPVNTCLVFTGMGGIWLRLIKLKMKRYIP